jgi:hypothetical protein
MHCSLFILTLVQNSALLVFVSVLSISENFLCSVSALLVKTVLLLEALQLLMVWLYNLCPRRIN